MEKKQTTNLKEMNEVFKLHIPASLEGKIRHLCNILPGNEWSGTLFYKVSGSIEMKNLVVECVDLCLMDVGSAGYTSYDESPDVINYRVDNGLLEPGIYEGLIHSHHNMQAYFSATDKGTLEKEGAECNHFVSLIVNNAGNYVAAITRKVTTETKAKARVHYSTDVYYDSYEDERVYMSVKEEKEEDKEGVKIDETIEYFNLEIDKAEVENNYADITMRVASIRESKKRTEKPVYNSWNDRYWDDSYYTRHNTYKPKENKSHEPFGVLSYNLTKQFVSGNIFINPESFSLFEFGKKIDSVYEKRFGILTKKSYMDEYTESEIQNNLDVLDDWLHYLFEFLISISDISDMEEMAMEIHKHLEKALPESFMKKKLIEVVEEYI